AGDLERALPQWSAVPADTPVAFAPEPGVQRVFRLAELRRLATQWHVPAGEEREFCVVRPAAPVSTERMLEAMRRQLPGARIELIEASRAAAPEGDVDFPLSGLHAGYWQGGIRYGLNHRFALWARVKVTV